jgi:hypothetical protein
VHAHAPHWQLAPQFWLPLPSQVCVAPAAQAPCAEHAPQADQTPAVHVRVCEPQLPHACEDSPVQAHCPPWQVEPLGHTLPQAPQCVLSVSRLAHEAPHNVGEGAEQELVQLAVPPSAAPASPGGVHMGVGSVHTAPHAPQLVAAERLAEHPAPASAQSAYPAAQR